jgi:hypothetical protein
MLAAGWYQMMANRLSQFAVAGEDKRFVWAVAEIVGDKVVVSSPLIAHPMYVRYAWSDNPEGANLYNREGLPASPFRTDSSMAKVGLCVTKKGQPRAVLHQFN